MTTCSCSEAVLKSLNLKVGASGDMIAAAAFITADNATAG